MPPTKAPAQQAPVPAVDKTSEEVIEMSPFVVSENTDVGYVATASLAGTRLKTDLRDIAAQIDVFTAEFLSDIAATNMVEAVAYSTNTADSDEQKTGPNTDPDARPEVRARGFNQITRSVDYFASNFPSDFYNTDRLTIANGPQSILFGLGNAGGVLDSTTKRAYMKSITGLQFRIDSWGSGRAAFDINREIVRNKLAVRVDGLYNDAQSFIEGGYNLQKRLFATVTYNPFRNSTIRVMGELLDQRQAVPSYFISRDFVTPWVAAGRLLFDNSKGNASIAANNPLFARNTNAVQVVSYGNNSIGNGISQAPGNGTAITKGPHQLAGAEDTRVGALVDSSIFPVSSDPRVGSNMNDSTGKMLRVFWEQKITNDFYLELAANYEELARQIGGTLYLADALNIRADPNMYLQGGTAASPVTTPNPNAGKLYIESVPEGFDYKFKTREARLTASYEFDFAKKTSPRWAWLGRYRLAGLVSYREDETRSQEQRALITGDPAFATGDKMNNSRFVRIRYYMDTGAGNVQSTAVPGQGRLGPWTFTHPTGETYNVVLFDNPEGSGFVPVGNKSKITTTMLSAQGFFLRDRVNLFFGWRSDAMSIYRFRDSDIVRMDQGAAGDQKGLYRRMFDARFEGDPYSEDTGITRTYGVVAHPFRWGSLFYSKSENTALPTGKLDPYNNPLPGTYSDGYDFGVRVSLLNNRIGLRLNFYEEDQNSFDLGAGQEIRTYAARIETRLRGPERPAGIADIPADGFDPVGRGNNSYSVVEDKRAKGLDLTIVGRPLPGWDIRVSVGKQHTYILERSQDFCDWIEHRLPVWRDAGGLGWENVTMSESDPQTIQDYYDTVLKREMITLGTYSGEDRFRQRRWRASFFTNYKFQEGSLRGFNVGGGVRWLDKSMVGWPLMVIPGTDIEERDTSHPYFDEPLFFVDLNLGYNLTRRLGGKLCKIGVQLNVRNLLDADDLEVLRASWDGSPLEVGRPTPRQVVVTMRLSF